MRVQLPALVARRDVDLREVSNTGDLDVIGCLDKVRALDGTRGHDARAVPALHTPRDLDALRVADNGARARARGREQAEVLERVDCGCAIMEGRTGAGAE